ncbi:unnamed protein product [Effrenium voratum]|nr:unnamed protein product [Effrenium voratum]
MWRLHRRIRMMQRLALCSALLRLTAAAECSAQAQESWAEYDLSSHSNDEEQDLLKMSLLQTGVKTPSVEPAGDTLSLFQEGDTLRLFQEGDVDRGIWDTLGGILHKAEKSTGEVQKSVLDTIVQQTDLAMDEFDKAVTKFEADAEEAETKFVNKANASIMEEVMIVKKKVASVMDKARALWRDSKMQVVHVQNIVVGTLSTVGQTDVAIKVNGTMVSLLKSLETASESTLTVAKDARSVSEETASCAVLKLNSTLTRATHQVEVFTHDFEEVFKVTDEKLRELAQKLPGQFTQQAQQACAQMRKRGFQTAENILRVYHKAAQNQILVIDRLQATCVQLGKACGEGGIFNNIKHFFKHLFRR